MAESVDHTEYHLLVVLGTQGKADYYSAISTNPEQVRRFANGMSLNSKLPTWAVTLFATHCGFDDPASTCPKKIVDVGGSDGELCKALLAAYPDIQEAVSLDRPEVVAEAQIPEHLEGRLKFGAYDFWEEQTEGGADVYLFRNIFHNWPDKYAVRIIQNQIPVLKKGNRIIVNEACLPELEDKTAVKNQLAW